MRTHVTISIWVLGISAVIAVILGIVTIVTAFTTTYDRVGQTTALMAESLEEIEQVVGVMQAHESELQELKDVPSRIKATMRHLPPLTKAGSEALAATSETVDSSANMIEAMDARGDLFLSGSPLKKSAAALRTNSQKLRALHKEMTEAQATLDSTVAASIVALEAAKSIGKELRGPAPSLNALEDRLHEMRGTFESGMLATGAAGAQAMLGGLYLLLGLLLGGLASLVAQLDRREFRSHEYSD